MSAGRTAADSVRTYFGIGPRTKWYGKRYLRREHITETLMLIVSGQDGEHRPATEAGARALYAPLLSWNKHVEGYRIDGELAMNLRALSPYQFVALLGQMHDAGVTNVGEGERFFSAMRQAA